MDTLYALVLVTENEQDLNFGTIHRLDTNERNEDGSVKYAFAFLNKDGETVERCPESDSYQTIKNSVREYLSNIIPNKIRSLFFKVMIFPDALPENPVEAAAEVADEEPVVSEEDDKKEPEVTDKKDPEVDDKKEPEQLVTPPAPVTPTPAPVPATPAPAASKTK